MKVLALLLTYWIQPSPDADLARWAFEAWQRESNGAIAFSKSDSEAGAKFKVHWVSGNAGLYGETVGGDIYVLPETRRVDDKLLRDAIVYLTCLHESGHALGLRHTDQFTDIMYTFANGGDITAYFARYRNLLKTRDDIRKYSGISDADRAALRAIYK